jgi:hypothetical protein
MAVEVVVTSADADTPTAGTAADWCPESAAAFFTTPTLRNYPEGRKPGPR